MKWFKNLNAALKITTTFGLLAVMLLLMGAITLSRVAHLNEITFQIFDRDVGGIDAIKQAQIDQAEIGRLLATAVLDQGNDEAIGFVEHDSAALFADLRTSLSTAYQRSIQANLRDQLRDSQAAVPEVERTAQDVFTRAKSNDRSAANQSLKSALASLTQLNGSLHQAVSIKKANVEVFKTSQTGLIQQTKNEFIWLMLSIIAVGALACFLVGRSFSQPLNRAVFTLEKVEQGDLTQRLDIQSKDEIGRMAQALNSALAKIGSLIVQVGEAARAVTEAAGQLAGSVDVMASGAHQQAASLEETSASLEQITATVRQNSDNARQASQLAISSRDAAQKGGGVVESAIGAMNEINDASGKIAAIVRVIDDISFQTNLLAVNASVEAARAREHGKGFAVVATEIRSLAQRCGSAAKEIKALIGDSRHKVEKGSTLVNRSGQTLEEIVSSVKRVTDIVGEIAAASREQSTGLEQVNSAMLQMDSVMQSNSSQTEELAATARLLASNAQNLEKMISHFLVHQQPGTGAPEHRPAAEFQAEAQGQTGADLSGLAANVGSSVSIEALDSEFEEF